MLLLKFILCVGLAIYWAVDSSAVEAQSSSIQAQSSSTALVPTPTAAVLTSSSIALVPTPTAAILPSPSTAISSVPATPEATPAISVGSGSMLEPVIEPPPITYGNLTCERYVAGGFCQEVLGVFPEVVTNLSRSDQLGGRDSSDAIVSVLFQFQASFHCINAAIPLLCRYSIPTCDPAFDIPVYQPICRRDCEIVRDFICPEPWQIMLQLLRLVNFGVIDQPDCEPLSDSNAGDAPTCISTLDGGDIPTPLRTGASCYSGRGRGYNGTVDVTESGRECQPWNATFPHQHLLEFGDYPELAGGHSYCRNPGGKGERPWCFTTDRSVRWEYCNVPQCDPGPMCEIYIGDICRTTGSIGMDLIFFDTSIAPQSDYERAMALFEEPIREFEEQCQMEFWGFLCTSNFPSCDLSHSAPRPQQLCRGYCERVTSLCAIDLERLNSFNLVLSHDPVVIPDCSKLPEANGGDDPECWQPITIPDFEEQSTSTCYSAGDGGQTYNGTIAITETGKVCQPWDAQSPHVHPITSLFRRYLEGHNYCRNPEGRGERLWCYTMDPNTRWEYCDISMCSTSEYLKYIYIIVPIVSGVLLILVAAMLICICCHWQRSSLKVKLPVEKDAEERYANTVVPLTSQYPDAKGGPNPLYALSPLPGQEQVEYDGVKLPEYPRESIIYIRDLGQGHFGVVVQAEAREIIPGREQSTVAVKVLKEGASVQVKKEFFREAALMHAFDHPNILKLLGVCIEQEPLCMIFEFMELGDLNNLLRQKAPGKWGSNPSLNRSTHLQAGLTTQQLVFICIDIAAGLEYLALNHYVHRDMATRNCLVSSNLRVKISDFGLSQDIYSTDYFRLGDSELLPIRWMPPEAIMYAKFTTQSDIWSFGVVLWEIFSFAIQPYYSFSNEEVVQHVRDGNVMSCPEGCPQEIYDLMLDCWAMESAERPTAGEIHMGLRRWNPDLSASLQQQQAPPTKSDYQNVAAVREMALQGSTTAASNGGYFVPDQSDLPGDGALPQAVRVHNQPSASESSLPEGSERASSEAPLMLHQTQPGQTNPMFVQETPSRETTPELCEDTV